MLLLIGIVIGLVLGLTGAGGSVFAVPLLLIVAGLDMHQAIGLSLLAVAASAIFGSLRFSNRQPVLWIPAWILSISGIAIVPFGQWLALQFNESTLIIGFSILAVLIAIRMWRLAVNEPALSAITRASDLSNENASGLLCRLSPTGQFQMRPRCVSGLLVGGMLVGLLSGLFGVGGGFLIVPLLLFLSQVNMMQAVSTSLIVISVISTIGFISHVLLVWQSGEVLPVAWMIWLLIGGISGMFLGQKLTHKIANAKLQNLFAFTLFFMALTMVAFHFLVGG
ncbi:sulfite exporter TauE/SafE family protein [Methylophaga sp. OBS3]|uniref:sulfite exporter TauE/SafE family protein n=1 Tax=Methylophaga sp. OBS3 TaxID=2991934 RepID=UPI0022534C0D|nr:sulfite exporter TauE/SafE family protein [Methylophaga sp. OBS3]MCX4189080.1 sulfite exporter TauE/SafE family protein [Methylophaga sp. OBS3]